MARGERVPSPYSRRWLLPWFIGDYPEAWKTVNYLSIAVSAIFVYLMYGIWAGIGFLCLPMVTLWKWIPGLVDSAGFALALGSVYAFHAGHLWVGMGLALLAGATKESTPIFIALWAWEPMGLIGLLAVKWWGSAPPDAWWLGSIRTVYARMRSRHHWNDFITIVAPWGLIIGLAGLGGINVWLCLVIAYGQLLIATDEIRLFQWACVPLLGLISVLPVWLQPIVAISPLFTRFRWKELEG